MSFSEEDLRKQQEETARLIAKAQEDAMAMVNAQMQGIQDQLGGMMDLSNIPGFGDQELFEFSENPATDPDIQWALSIMAFTSMRYDLAVNGLESNMAKEEVQNSLDEGWGIQDSEGLQKQIFWLEDQGHRDFYQAVLDIARENPDKHAALIKAALQDNIALAAVEYDDFAERIEILSEYLFHIDKNEIDSDEADAYKALQAVTNVQIWDDARIIMLCRMGIDAEWISEADATEKMKKIAKPIKKVYKDTIAANAAYFVASIIHFGTDYLLFTMDFQEFIDNVDKIWE